LKRSNDITEALGLLSIQSQSNVEELQKMSGRLQEVRENVQTMKGSSLDDGVALDVYRLIFLVHRNR
jgi:dsDNA-specific endonuclease/ATPase MutS2